MTGTVTFVQLTEALTGLGFKKITTEEFTAYNNAAYDALLILPPEGLLTHPLPMHALSRTRRPRGKEGEEEERCGSPLRGPITG